MLEAASLTFAALVQQRLIRAGGRSLRFTTLAALTIAATAVMELVPAGVAPASVWLAEQYHSRKVPLSLAAWTILASGFAATVTLLGLLLVGAGIGGIWSPAGLASAGGVLVLGSAGFVAVVHRMARWERWMKRRFTSRPMQAAARFVEDATRYRASARGGLAVLACSSLNWVFDAGVLVIAFEILGMAVPWRALLFAYAASQVAGGFTFLPAGLGAVECGMVGGCLVAGLPAANALVATLAYRVVAYWGVGAVGGLLFLVESRRGRGAG
jgi:uncharacterized protein (TIRG00374 family)